MNPSEKFRLPVEDPLLEFGVACSACGQRAPFNLREWEDGPVPPGWQMRLIGTELIHKGQTARSWRWDLFCPADAGEMNPRIELPGSIRMRIEMEREEDENS